MQNLKAKKTQKVCFLTHQIRTAHAASDSEHKTVLKSKEVLSGLFSPASVFSFWTSLFPVRDDVSETSSVNFCDFFLCFTSVGISANDALLINFTKKFTRFNGKKSLSSNLLRRKIKKTLDKVHF